MTVHKRDNHDDSNARCGAKFAKNLRGLDACDTWNDKVGNPVSCPDCILFHRPFMRKVAKWEGMRGKTR